MALGCEPFIGDPFGQPVPPRLQPLFRTATSGPSIIAQLRRRKNSQQIVRYIEAITPGAICPLCVGEGCFTCIGGYYSLSQLDGLGADVVRQIRRFL